MKIKHPYALAKQYAEDLRYLQKRLRKASAYKSPKRAYVRRPKYSDWFLIEQYR
jgi:hypothetical protein